MKINFIHLLLCTLIIGLSGCSDSNSVLEQESPEVNASSSFEEYINFKENNPVNTLIWLSERKAQVKAEMESEESAYTGIYSYLSYPLQGYIDLYDLEGISYYFVKYPTYRSMLDGIDSFIYSANGEIYASLGGDTPSDENRERFESFFENAQLKERLWEYTFVMELSY